MNIPGTEPNLVADSLHDLLSGPSLTPLQELLPAYLLRQRWFGAKSRTITSVRILDWVALPNLPAAIVFVAITYAEAAPDAPADVYQLPLALTTGPEAEIARANAPASILAWVTTPAGPMILHDATAREDVRQAFLALIEAGATLTATTSNPEPRTSNPTLSGHTSTAFAAARGLASLPARTGSAEQSNTSILYGDKLILKLFRRLQPGENPDTEIGRFLTEVAHFPRIAPFLGEIRGSREGERSPPSQQTTLAMLQGLVANEGDGWQFTLDELARYYAYVLGLPMPSDTGDAPSFLDDPNPPPIPADVREHAGLSSDDDRGNASYPAEVREYAGLSLAALLGRRTAEMHLALATPTDNPAFAAEPFTAEALAADTRRIRTQIVRTLDALKQAFSNLTGELTIDSAALILSRRIELFSRAFAIAEVPPVDAGQRIRIHGDYHLGQVLRARGDYVILDFEGEPARPLAERRAKQSPLKDVAGMLRSFSYAAYAALDRFVQRRPGTAERLEPWAQLWQNAAATEFLTAWRTTIAANPSLTPEPLQAHRLLNAYLLEKALYELLYELNNRPTWVRIPLAGILALPAGAP